MEAAAHYRLAGSGAAALQTWLDRLDREPAGRERFEFRDTFDRALLRHHQSLSVELSRDEPRAIVRLRDVRSGAVVASAPLPEGADPAAPWSVADLPEVIARRVGARVGVRALLPLVAVDCSTRAYRERDAEGKTVLRVRVERATAEREGRRRRLRTTVRLLPVAGYGAALQKAARMLASVGLASAGDLLSEAVAAVRAPAPPPSIHDVALDPAERADDAVRRLLAVLLTGTAGNVDGLRRDVDPEFLHDLRVAVRRSRSALARIRDVLPAKAVGPLREELRWLGQLTGPARDLDVWLLDFDALAALVPPGSRADLEPLREVLRAERVAARAELVEAIDGPRFAALLDRFRAVVRAKGPRRRGAPSSAARPVLTVARREIDRAYRRVLRDGRAVTDASSPAELHELRKTCKKLRYLLELFRSLFPDEAAEIIAALRALQETLGAIQDREVQVATLAALGEEMGGPPATLLAMGSLAAALQERQTAARSELATRFAAFDAKPLRRTAKKLFREPVDRAAA